MSRVFEEEGISVLTGRAESVEAQGSGLPAQLLEVTPGLALFFHRWVWVKIEPPGDRGC